MNDQFGDWEEYLTAVESQGQVCVMGVTDYLSIQGYSTLKKHKDAGRIQNIDLLVPAELKTSSDRPLRLSWS